jgi:Na+-driven multidrug efflux pump
MTGLCAAVSIITGKTVGAGEFGLMKLYAKTVQILFLGIGVLCGITIFVSKAAFLSFYTLAPGTVMLAGQFLSILSVTTVGTSYQAACLAGLVKAGGDTGFVFKNDAIFVFLIVLPSAAIALFALHAPAWAVFMCLKSDQILKCFVAAVKINSFNWMKNLTRNFSG